MQEFDFHRDLISEIENILEISRIKISTNQNIQQILIDFFNLKSKILEPKKRNVMIAPSLRKQIEEHHKKAEIQTIIKYANNGENLNCFQSDKIIESKQIDHLSNEWNVFHFHLSLVPGNKDKFVKRGNLLLFAYIDDVNAIFLGLDKHKGSFSNIKWLEILEESFPHILEKNLAPDLPKIGQNFTTSDREKMWQGGVSSGFMKINGKTYLCPGFGKVTSDHNIQVVMQANNILNWITHVKNIIIKDSEYFNDKVSHLKLRIGEKTIEIYENVKGNILFEYPSLLTIKEMR